MLPRSLTPSVTLSKSLSVVSIATCPSENETRGSRQVYGVNPNICDILSRRIFQRFTCSTHPKHSFWALRFLMPYGSKAVYVDEERCTEKTFRIWCWEIVNIIADMDLGGMKELKTLHFQRCSFSNFSDHFMNRYI